MSHTHKNTSFLPGDIVTYLQCKKKLLNRAAQVAQWFSAAFSPGRGPGELGSPGSLHGAYPASPSACISVSLSHE